MHIGFQTSGGRGEYEVVGSLSGYTAASLEGWTFNLWWPDGIVRDTGLELEPGDSGKPRLRSLRDKRFQVGRQIAAMLLLPDPRRDFRKLETDLERFSTNTPTTKGYVLTKIGFAPETNFTNIHDIATIHPNFVELNCGNGSEPVGVQARHSRLQRVYSARASLGGSLPDLLSKHQAFLASGQDIDDSLRSLVLSIQQEIHRLAPHITDTGDPLPILESWLMITKDDGPELPPPNCIGEELPEMRQAAADQYRRARSRGSSGAIFRREVLSAYRHQCVFCGARLGGVQGIISGIDAAHILPWNKYDADTISNGLGLCKLHHWSFDTSLYLPVHHDGKYTLRFSELALARFDRDALAHIGEDRFDIPTEWLPGDMSLWPNTRFLTRLYEDLEVVISL